MRGALLALTAVLLTAAPSLAASPPGLEDPEATVLSELVVKAVRPAPAWWTVQKGGSVVYILGLPEVPVPKRVAWNQAPLQQHLAGANVLIVPVEGKAGLGDILPLLRMRSRLKSKTPMEQTLPEPLRTRFVAARTRLGKPASRYAGWDPIFAGQILVGDLYQAAQSQSINGETIAAITVRQAARRAHVPIRPAASFRVVGLLDPAIRNLTPQISQTCLAGALDDVEAGPEALDAKGAAWARGDVPGVLAGPRGFASCLLLIQGGAAFWRQTMAEEADAVAAELAKPGHAVAMFPIRSLVAEDGILARLKARGFEVSRGRS